MLGIGDLGASLESLNQVGVPLGCAQHRDEPVERLDLGVSFGDVGAPRADGPIGIADLCRRYARKLDERRAPLLGFCGELDDALENPAAFFVTRGAFEQRIEGARRREREHAVFDVEGQHRTKQFNRATRVPDLVAVDFARFYEQTSQERCIGRALGGVHQDTAEPLPGPEAFGEGS